MLYGEYNLIIKQFISFQVTIRFLDLEIFYRLIRNRDVCNHRNQRNQTEASAPNATCDPGEINSQPERNSDYLELGNSGNRELGNSGYLELGNAGYLEPRELS